MSSVIPMGVSDLVVVREDQISVPKLADDSDTEESDDDEEEEEESESKENKSVDDDEHETKEKDCSSLMASIKEDVGLTAMLQQVVDQCIEDNDRPKKVTRLIVSLNDIAFSVSSAIY